MNSRYKWGIDLGGTKIEAIILDSHTENSVVERQRVPTLASQGYDTVLKQIEKLIILMKSKSVLEPESIGIGTPGRLDPDSLTLKNSNTTCLNGRHFHSDLESLLGLKIKIENDANCFALSEANYLSNNGYENAEVIIGIILGTGVGGGIIANGKVISGVHGIGGEWGHNFLDESGGECYCGKTGCVETVISGPALENFYHSLTNNKKNLKEINQLALNQDAAAVKTLDRLHHFFGKGISQLINILDPSVIVIGGGVGNIDSLYTRGVDQVMEFLFNNNLKTKFVKPNFGDSSGVFGAALL